VIDEYRHRPAAGPTQVGIEASPEPAVALTWSVPFGVEWNEAPCSIPAFWGFILAPAEEP
jgi:hypothetical protein